MKIFGIEFWVQKTDQRKAIGFRKVPSINVARSIQVLSFHKLVQTIIYLLNWSLQWFGQVYDLVSYVVCVNFIQEWCDLQFNVDSKRQHFIESQRFCQKPFERKSPKKYFLILHFTIPSTLWCKKYLHHFLIILHYLCTLTIEDLKWNTTLMSKQMLRRLLSFLDHVRRGIIHTRLTRVLQPALHNGQNLFFSPTSLYRVSCRL